MDLAARLQLKHIEHTAIMSAIDRHFADHCQLLSEASATAEKLLAAGKYQEAHATMRACFEKKSQLPSLEDAMKNVRLQVNASVPASTVKHGMPQASSATVSHNPLPRGARIGLATVAAVGLTAAVTYILTHPKKPEPSLWADRIAADRMSTQQAQSVQRG